MQAMLKMVKLDIAKLEVAVVGVGLARKHRLDLARLGLAGERADRGLGLADDAGVALLFAELDQPDIVIERARQPLDRLDAVLEALALAHQLLRFGRVVP